MAKQRRTGQGAARGGRDTRGRGAGPVVLVVVRATVAVGGWWLYRRTLPPTERQVAPAVRERVGSAGAGAGPGTGIGTGTDAGVPGSGGPLATRPSAAGVPARSSVAGAPGVAMAPAGNEAKRPLPQAPFGESEEVFETGAKVYGAHCASCHGRPGHAAAAKATQLWDGRSAAVGRMVAQPPGALYLQIAGGVPAQDGMPAMAGYAHVLSETEMWDLAMLLRNARQELPDPVMHLLRTARP